jgi:signal transduction histidine kinase
MGLSKVGSGGTSLGLAMGGKIYAHNASGGGAAFHILMPTKQSGDTVPAPL